MGNSQGTMDIYPSSLRYTQDSIQDHFHFGQKLTTTYEEFLRKETTPTDLPDMQVMKYNGTWYVIKGNRRLFLYKRLEELNVIGQIRVTWLSLDEEKFRRRYTSKNDGLSIKVNPDVAVKLREIDERHLTEACGCSIQ